MKTALSPTQKVLRSPTFLAGVVLSVIGLFLFPVFGWLSLAAIVLVGCLLIPLHCRIYRMPLLSLPIFHSLARKFGTASLKQAAMNARFASGDWSGYSEPPEFVRLIESLAQGGNIVVLGCGGNPLGRALKPNSYATMYGVDLSEAGIKIARADAPPRQFFQVANMLDYRPAESPDLVVFSESIYYLPTAEILPLLKFWQGKLVPGGSIVVTIAFPESYPEIIRLIRDNFQVREDRQIFPGAKRHLMVFG